MNTMHVAVGVCVVGEHTLDLEAFAMTAGVDVARIQQWVEEGLLMPSATTGITPTAATTITTPPAWRFDGEALARARRILRLQRDFDANLQSVAVMLQLLDEIETLRAHLRRAGIRLPD
jgi:chaperone modulatory protein CbpM